MKRLISLLLALLSVLLLLPANAAEGSASAMVTAYDRIVNSARDRYGYSEVEDIPCLAYDPIYIDPVAYLAYINHDHGAKDGELFIIQGARSPELTENYLTHLEKFGYVRQNERTTADGMACSLVLPEPWASTATIPAVIDMEYVNDPQMLVVRYDDRYGLVNRIWRHRALTGGVAPLPTSVSDGRDGSVTLKKVMTAVEADCLNIPLDHWLDQTDFDLWNTWGVYACVWEDHMNAGTFADSCGWAENTDTVVPLLQLDIDGAAFDPERCFLVMRSPDEGVMLHPLLFWGEEVPGQEMFTVDMSRSGNENLWLVFSPYPYEKDIPLRLYMDLSDSESGSPMENWAYIDFMLPARP